MEGARSTAPAEQMVQDWYCYRLLCVEQNVRGGDWAGVHLADSVWATTSRWLSHARQGRCTRAR